MPPQDETIASGGDNPFRDVPIEIVVTVGRARPKVSDLLRLRADDVLPLDRRLSDPVELYVADRLMARGELEEVGAPGSGMLAVRLTEVLPPRVPED